MQFHDLGAQYRALKAEIDAGIAAVLEKGHFILGEQVSELEDALARDVGRRHCVTCGNGTDALVLALMLAAIRSAPVEVARCDAVNDAAATTAQ